MINVLPSPSLLSTFIPHHAPSQYHNSNSKPNLLASCKKWLKDFANNILGDAVAITASNNDYTITRFLCSATLMQI